MHLIMKLKARFFMEMQLVIFFFFGEKKNSKGGHVGFELETSKDLINYKGCH